MSLAACVSDKRCRGTDRGVVMLSLAIGTVLVSCILVRYINSRKKFLQWSTANQTFGQVTNGFSSHGLSTNGSGKRKAAPLGGIYDRWLLVRFTIAFVLLP